MLGMRGAYSDLKPQVKAARRVLSPSTQTCSHSAKRKQVVLRSVWVPLGATPTLKIAFPQQEEHGIGVYAELRQNRLEHPDAGCLGKRNPGVLRNTRAYGRLLQAGRAGYDGKASVTERLCDFFQSLIHGRALLVLVERYPSEDEVIQGVISLRTPGDREETDLCHCCKIPGGCGLVPKTLCLA